MGSYSNQNQISFDVWLRDIFKDSKNSDSILQMDIEGAEIETLLSISEDYLNNFRIIVIEFHDFSRLFVKDFF
ncbi:FkbM family methyltransferase [Algoriphagus boritolerans]|uniref:FkbM family methyltransferase n=1 Tax=Algoriphagus boritolerans TaxID=308111 RepID=UPI003A0FB8F4